MSKLKSVLFVSGDPYANDLEWKLPLILEYWHQGHKVQVFVLYRLKSTPKNFFLWILEQNNIPVFYREDLGFLEPCPNFLYLRLLNNTSKIVRFISRFYFSESHMLTKILLVRWIRRQWAKRKIWDLLKQVDSIYLCQYPNIHKMVVLSMFQLLAPTSKAMLVGVPDAAHIHWQEDKISDYDLMLLNTDVEGEEFAQISDIPYLVSGCLHFRHQWQQNLIRYYQDFQEQFANNDPSLPVEKELVLLLLVKPDHFFWKNISYKQVVSKLCQSIASPDRYILIKPHPRTNLVELKTMLDPILGEHYQIVTDSVNYWSSIADRVVSSLTYSTLSVLSMNKVPYVYWPITDNYESFLKHGGNLLLTTYFLKDKTVGGYQSLFSKYAIDVFSEKFEFPPYDKALIAEKLKAFSNDFKLSRKPYELIVEINNKKEELGLRPESCG